MKHILAFLVGLGILALVVGYTGEAMLASIEVQRAQAEAKAAHARADQAVAETAKLLAETLAERDRVEARENAAQTRLYQAAIVLVAVWSALLIGVLVFVVIRLMPTRPTPEVVYLPKQDLEKLLPGDGPVDVSQEMYRIKRSQHSERSK